jgi:enoyl-CoA hydratase/carnithine racemase
VRRSGSHHRGSAWGLSTGLDLEALTGPDEGRAPCCASYLSRYEALLTALERRPEPVVALVDGPALGGGLGVAAVADLVLASPHASFALPETLVGLIPALVFPVVARRVGVPRARLLALGGKPLTAAAALDWGLIDAIAQDLEGALQPYLQRFVRMDNRAVSAVKALVATHFAVPPAYPDDATERFVELATSRETRARLRRFAAGEAPWQEESTC